VKKLTGHWFEPAQELDRPRLKRGTVFAPEEGVQVGFLRSFPYLVQDLIRQRRLILWQEATIVLLHDIRSVLNGRARVLI
jgi:hypothetical protein